MKAAQDIDWIRKPETAFDPDAGAYGRWFPDGVCNACWNAVDRHVAAGHGDRLALVHDSPVTETVQRFSFSQLQTEVGALAEVLRRNGVEKGDRVIIYMPMVPEAIFAMLACARLGAIRKEDPDGALIGRHDLSRFRTLFLAGERSDPATIKWAQQKLQRPVIDHWWQTETGWPMSGNPVGLGALPVKPGSPGVPMPGYEIEVLSDEGHPLPAGTLGNIVCKLPLPPSGTPTLWNAEDRFFKAYLEEFPGYYATSDAGIIDEDGYVFIMARTDDIINVAGHRLSTGAMEEVISAHKDIAECAVVGAADALKGQMPIGFFVQNDGAGRDPGELERELVALVREKIGAVAAFKTAMEVERLPKTRSGKVLRGTMQKLADNEDFKMPAAIDDPAILDEISGVLSRRGYGKGTA